MQRLGELGPFGRRERRRGPLGRGEVEPVTEEDQSRALSGSTGTLVLPTTRSSAAVTGAGTRRTASTATTAISKPKTGTTHHCGTPRSTMAMDRPKTTIDHTKRPATTSPRCRAGDRTTSAALLHRSLEGACDDDAMTGSRRPAVTGAVVTVARLAHAV
ncbi:hypothetical protein AB0J83_38705 [Actinoplanes sp. NPDC049596]|uniref:hypothetical protein n=1 Tax=unclassified Actinoplanes TaxID=2626549 RepID=UPI00342D8C78